MIEGYAIYEATLGPRGQQAYGVDNDRAFSWSEPVSILVALDDESDSPLVESNSGAHVVRVLDVATAELVGAINLSTLRWGSRWPEGRWLLDGADESVDGEIDDPAWAVLIRTEGHS